MKTALKVIFIGMGLTVAGCVARYGDPAQAAACNAIKIGELAWLSAQVYFDASAPPGWSRYGKSAGNSDSIGGFYATAYKNGPNVVPPSGEHR